MLISFIRPVTLCGPSVLYPSAKLNIVYDVCSIEDIEGYGYYYSFTLFIFLYNKHRYYF